MKNRFNLNESEKNKIRSLHGIKLINEQPSTDADGTINLDPSMTIQDNLANLTKQDKVGIVTCAEQNYDIPGLVINKAGSIADNMLRSDAMEGKDESEMYGFWMAAFMNNLLIDKGTDSKLVEDIKNSTGCMYEILKKHDMLDIVMNESINEDAGMDTPGGNPDYFYDEDSVFTKLRNREENSDTESMSNDDIGSLNRMIKKYSPEKILATMSILRKRPLSEEEEVFPDDLENMLNNLTQQDSDMKMSKQDIINELIGIYSYSQDGAIDLVNTALENLIYNLGGFKE